MSAAYIQDLVLFKLDMQDLVHLKLDFFMGTWEKTIWKIVSMIRKYHNHKPQTTPWHREEEPLNHHETPGNK